MYENLLDDYNLKTDKERKDFIKFAILLYKLEQNDKEKFYEYAEILKEILREQQERENN
ncbi:TPA: hypothetical protein KNH77_003379 [Clostridioides difficile]|uniref:hypothetical protein n=1 Tax=Clostridioides difficile TaxID=1496 RepID=UPI00038D98A3|nr:hypothetical protein [Clostridioides difficile]EJA6384762.1 hypothetical protein [Clostridioides difficile]EJA6623829.1 hypothetical protein [Clostridioides difficile]ELX4512936.1 hypothetical protein [Clostridioides difficile]EQE88265.1 hypothetical protein QCQ_4083 [Clostridioides difficile CD49]EQG22184.1 hypothetical protein QII_3018 [Clostridioides difficile DA00114]